ncbi:hypothetical protein K2173_003747 [Erythroxylum novogranatense]|uniref:Uncharacterized protein n=1 Tax=Erythroxylum novogranatense TaxID=1862640 RepID=A0AAV8TCW7_9ROSI|nr:hypothetical protein K2173_003747 [Erythroxylum novogranatense]
MEDKIVVKVQKDGNCGGNTEVWSSSISKSKSKKLVRRVNSQNSLILNFKQFQRSKGYIKESFLQRSILGSWIPKHMVSADEKYFRRCLELIHISASKTAACDISLNWNSENVSFMDDGLDPGKVGCNSAYVLAGTGFDSPLAAATGNVLISSSGQWIVGSIMGSKSMVNILKNPLLEKYGAFDGGANFKEMLSSDVNQSTSYNFMESPIWMSNYSSHKMDKGVPSPRIHKCGPDTLHERLVSISSTNSTCSDQPSSSLSDTTTQGMLQCIYKDSNPHFVFSVDDQKVVYVANLLETESMDCMYLFHSIKGGQREHEIHDNDSHLIGKMKISTSFTFCPDNCRIMQREFVLFGGNEIIMEEMHTSSQQLKKNKGFSKKVADAFRTSRSMKKRTKSTFGGSSAVMERYSLEPFQDIDNNVDALGGAKLSEDHLPPNLELAAIVVKDHLPEIRQEKGGGWGMKFLKKVRLKQKSDATEGRGSSCCTQNPDSCSISMDVIVPAGLHGGPRTRNGGPSSLIERWRSGGSCDCGGWDLGCPLTILRSNMKEHSSEAETQRECKFTEFFIQGLEKGFPSLRMVNVYDGLYFVNFQSSLSALQSFSIAVALIHSQNPALQSKNV